MDLTGQTLRGKYEIESLLGRGGMGAVWRARHAVTGRSLAIKVLDESFLDNEPIVQRFGREARAASAVEHPGIVEVLDLDRTDQGVPFLVMEYLEGETLARRIERRGRLRQPEMMRIATLLLEALDAAHSHGVVHRDLKPENIYLVPGGSGDGEAVKILDFGISSKADEEASKLTMTGSVLGTPHYMSPEQAMGEAYIDHRSDIYSAGICLYECAVGDVPYDANNYNRLLRRVLDEVPTAPRERGAHITGEVEQVIMWALEKDRTRRVPTAREMLQWLQRAEKGEKVPYETPESSPFMVEDDGSEPLERVRATEQAPPRSGPPARTPDYSGAELEGIGQRSGRPGAVPPPAPGARPASTISSRTFKRPSRDGSSARPSAPEPAPPPPPTARGSNPGEARGSNPGSGGDARASGAHGVPETAKRGATIDLSGAHSRASLANLDDQEEQVSLELDEVAMAEREDMPLAARTRAAKPVTGTTQSLRPERAVGVSEANRLSGSRPRPTAPPPPSPTGRYVGLATLLLVAVLGIFFALRYFVRPTSGPPEALPAPSSTDAPTVDDLYVTVTLSNLPANAQIRLDGIPVRNPVRVRRGVSQVIEVRAENHEARRIELTPDGDQVLDGHLTRLPGH